MDICRARIPPWGNLYTVNVNTGKIVWRVNLGVTDSLPEGKKNTGRGSLGAPLTTAGGLTFIGATDDSRFRAFETKTGKEIWTYKLDASAHASPVSYRGTDGKQYVAVVATSEFFAAPQSATAWWCSPCRKDGRAVLLTLAGQ